MNKPCLATSIILIIFLTIFCKSVYAASPTQVNFYNNGWEIPYYFYGDNGKCLTSCLKFGTLLTGGYSDSYTINNKWINFTNISFTSQTNPSYEFGVGIQKSNTTMTDITNATVQFTTTFNPTTFSTGIPYLHFFRSTFFSTAMPPVVLVQTGTYTTTIPQSSYITSPSSFASCTTPCVFGNFGNQTVIVKYPNFSPESTTICLTLQNCTNSINTAISPGYSIDSDPAIPILIVLIVIVGLILALAFSRRGES